MPSATNQRAKEFLASFPDEATLEDVERELRLRRTGEHKWSMISNVVQKALAALALYWAYKSAEIILGLLHAGNGKLPSGAWSFTSLLPWVCFSWSALPPMWFLFEFWFFFPKLDKSMDEFKYSQELAKGFWKGIAVVLLTLMLKGGA